MINKRNSEFRYLKLAEIIKNQIALGLIKPGEYLLSENDLCKKYLVSRTSVRKALEILESECIIEKMMGKGSMVSASLKLTPYNEGYITIFATSPSNFIDVCMPKMIQEFEKAYPNIKVKLIDVPEDNLLQTLRSSQEIGVVPDLIFVSDRQVSEIREIYRFEDLKALISSEIMEPIYPKLLNSFNGKESVYSIPLTFSPVFLAYNPVLFDRHHVEYPSMKWDKYDFIRAGQKMTVDTNGDGILDQYGFSLSTSFSRWPYIALQLGVDFKNSIDKNKLFFALDFIHDIIYRHKITSASPSNVLNSDAFFFQKAAMVLTTAIELSGWKYSNIPFEPKISTFSLDSLSTTLLVANLLMIPENSHNKTNAVKFIEHALCRQSQEMMQKDFNFIPVISTIPSRKNSKANQNILSFKEFNLENGYFLHELISDWDVIDEITSETGLFWLGMDTAAVTSEKILSIIESHKNDAPVE